jgi:hypothetical protein
VPRHKFHDHVVPNADDIVPLIERYISVDPSGAGTRVRQEAMKCFQVRDTFCSDFLLRPKLKILFR